MPRANTASSRCGACGLPSGSGTEPGLMVSSFDLENTQPEWALCYRFNIVLRGKNATPMENK